MPMPEESSAENESTISDEEMAFLTKTLWESLLAPRWAKDDLIDFGKAIFAKTSLKDMDDKTFDAVFPFLKQISVSIAKRLSALATPPAAEASKPPEPKTPKAETPKVEAPKAEAPKTEKKKVEHASSEEVAK